MSNSEQIKLADLADQIVDRALAAGESFSAELCNWAIEQAQDELGL